MVWQCFSHPCCFPAQSCPASHLRFQRPPARANMLPGGGGEAQLATLPTPECLWQYGLLIPSSFLHDPGDGRRGDLATWPTIIKQFLPFLLARGKTRLSAGE